MSSGSLGKGSSKSSQSVTIPDFLRPLVEQAAGTAGGALQSLQQQINPRYGQGPNLVADFAPAQQLAQALGTQRAISGDLSGGAMDVASQIAQGGQVPGADVAGQIAQGGAIPELTMQTLMQGAQGMGAPAGQAQLEQLASGQMVPDEARQALSATSGGDYLAGGQGFDEAVEASIRAAQPGVLSTFGSAGRGGATGGLAQTAMSQVASDAFARQFAQERQNQIGAAGQLADLGLAETGQRANIAGLLSDLGMQQQGQQLGAAQTLGDLGLAQGQQQLQAALGMGDLGLGGQQQQLQAASTLPELGSLDISLLSDIGGQQQDLEQMRLGSPLQAQLELLNAALGAAPVSSFLGQRGRSSSREAGIGFDISKF